MRRRIAARLFFALILTTSSLDVLAASATVPKTSKPKVAGIKNAAKKPMNLNINDKGALEAAINSSQVKELNEEIEAAQSENVLDELPLRPEFRYVENEEYRGDVNARNDKEFRVKYNLSF